MQTAVLFCPVPTDNNHKQGSIKQFSLEEQTLTGSARIDTRRNQLVSSGFLISLFFFLSFVLLPWPYTAQMANSMALLLISS